MTTMTALHRSGAFMAPAALVLALGTTAPVSAATAAPAPAATSDADACAEQASGQAATSMNQVEGATAINLTDKVAAALSSGQITTEAAPGALSLDAAEVYSISSERTDVTSVTVPVEGDYGLLSNLTVIFDADGNTVQSSESLLTENAAGNVTVSIFDNGTLVGSDDTDRPFMTDEEMLGASDAGVASTRGVNNTAACVACIGAYASFGGVSVTQVASCF